MTAISKLRIVIPCVVVPIVIATLLWSMKLTREGQQQLAQLRPLETTDMKEVRVYAENSGKFLGSFTAQADLDPFRRAISHLEPWEPDHPFFASVFDVILENHTGQTFEFEMGIMRSPDTTVYVYGVRNRAYLYRAKSSELRDWLLNRGFLQGRGGDAGGALESVDE